MVNTAFTSFRDELIKIAEYDSDLNQRVFKYNQAQRAGVVGGSVGGGILGHLTAAAKTKSQKAKALMTGAGIAAGAITGGRAAGSRAQKKYFPEYKKEKSAGWNREDPLVQDTTKRINRVAGSAVTGLAAGGIGGGMLGHRLARGSSAASRIAATAGGVLGGAYFGTHAGAQAGKAIFFPNLRERIIQHVNRGDLLAGKLV